jgi:hypothetical protein
MAQTLCNRLGHVIQMSVAEASDDDESVVVFTYCPTDASWEDDAGIEDQVCGWDQDLYQEPLSFYHDEGCVHYSLEALGVPWYDEAVDKGFLNVPGELPSLGELHEQDEDACKTPEIFFESRMPSWNTAVAFSVCRLGAPAESLALRG